VTTQRAPRGARQLDVSNGCRRWFWRRLLFLFGCKTCGRSIQKALAQDEASASARSCVKKDAPWNQIVFYSTDET